MEKKTIVLFLAIILSLCGIAFAEDKNNTDSQGASVELRFVCETSEPNCTKMVSEDNKEELFLESRPQFTIRDLGFARVVSNDFTEFKKTEDKRKSLILKGKEETFEPPTDIILYFTEDAKEKLAKVTSENIRRRLGLVIDGRLIMAPRILEPVTEGEIKVTSMNITKKYAEDLVSRINTITKMDEEQVKTIFLKGLAYAKNGMYDEAIAQFNKVIHFNPNRAEAYGNRAIVYYYKGEYAKSWDDIYKAEELGLKKAPSFLEKLRKASGREN